MAVPCKVVGASAFAALLLVFCICTASVAYAQVGQSSALQNAEQTVGQAYDAVLAAQKAGANVTSLVNSLNGVAILLGQAENEYRVGDSAAASADAASAVTVALQVMVAAQSAAGQARASAETALWSNLALAVVGSIVFLLVLLFVWRWFKRRYISSLSEARPEVISA